MIELIVFLIVCWLLFWLVVTPIGIFLGSISAKAQQREKAEALALEARRHEEMMLAIATSGRVQPRTP